MTISLTTFQDPEAGCDKATHSDFEDSRFRSVGRLTTNDKLSNYVDEFYRGDLDEIVLSVDEDCDARKDVKTPGRAFKFHPFYFSIGIVFPFSDFQSEFLCFYSYAPCQWTPESYRLLLGFERLNKWYDIGMGLNEFRALFRVTCQSTLRQYISFHATGKWTEHPFVQGVRTDRDWSLDVITVSGNWETQRDKYPIPINWKHEKNLDALNKVDSVRVDLIDAFYSIPREFRELEWVINPVNDIAVNRGWVRPFVDLGANPIFASGDQLKVMYDQHLVSVGKKKGKARKGSDPATRGGVVCADRTRKRKMEVEDPKVVQGKSTFCEPADDASMSYSKSCETTLDVEEIVFNKQSGNNSDDIDPDYGQMRADLMKSQVNHMPVSTVNMNICNITSPSQMMEETGVLFMGADNEIHMSSIKDGSGADMWSDAIFSPTDVSAWLGQSVQSLQEDVFLGWYQTMGRTKALLCKYAAHQKEAMQGWEIDKVKLMSAATKNHELEVELADIRERFKGMRDNLENQVAGARFGIECKNKKIGVLEQQLAEVKASHEKEMQLIKNQHEARVLEMEDEKSDAIEKEREALMKAMELTSDGEEFDGTDQSS